MAELYKNIKRLRLERGLSQDELARLTGYRSRTSIAKIEAGKVDLSQSKIRLFASRLGVSAIELLGDDGKPEPHETERLLSLYQQLNDKGRSRLMEYMDDLLGIEKYRR